VVVEIVEDFLAKRKQASIGKLKKELGNKVIRINKEGDTIIEIHRIPLKDLDLTITIKEDPLEKNTMGIIELVEMGQRYNQASDT